MSYRLSYSTRLAWRGIALAVAYAFTLQVMLASVVAAGTALTQADASAICYGAGNNTDDGGKPHSPTSFADCILYCVQGVSATAILPPDLSPPLLAVKECPAKPSATAFVLASRPSPKLAQGPPQNA